MKLAFFAAAVLIAATTAFAPRADDRPFLLHVNANTIEHNCKTSEWSTPSATCAGRAAPSGHSYSFSENLVTVEWCDAQCAVGKGYTMPSGYVRWMKICAWMSRTQPHCDDNNWLLGAVQMPNGPFHVMAGMIHGQPVQRDNGDQGMVGKTGGPLALIVKYTGNIKYGTPFKAPGYTIGLVGRIK